MRCHHLCARVWCKCVFATPIYTYNRVAAEQCAVANIKGLSAMKISRDSTTNDGWLVGWLAGWRAGGPEWMMALHATSMQPSSPNDRGTHSPYILWSCMSLYVLRMVVRLSLFPTLPLSLSLCVYFRVFSMHCTIKLRIQRISTAAKAAASSREGDIDPQCTFVWVCVCVSALL